MNCLRGSFAPYWQSIQRARFPQLEPVLGPLTGKQQQLVQTLEVIRIEQWIPRCFRVPGRPRKDRAALARAFVAKAVYDMPTTRVLLDRLVTDVALRRICGWERKSEVPSESVFSRAFAEFSDIQLPQRTHAALIRNTHHDRLVGHLCRDSTAIEAREKPAAKEKTPPLPKRERGRPNKGEERPKVLKRLDRHVGGAVHANLVTAGEEIALVLHTRRPSPSSADRHTRSPRSQRTWFHRMKQETAKCVKRGRALDRLDAAAIAERSMCRPGLP